MPRRWWETETRYLCYSTIHCIGHRATLPLQPVLNAGDVTLPTQMYVVPSACPWACARSGLKREIWPRCMWWSHTLTHHAPRTTHLVFFFHAHRLYAACTRTYVHVGSCIYSLDQSTNHDRSLTHSRAHSLTHSLNESVDHYRSLNHSLTHPFTHSLT